MNEYRNKRILVVDDEKAIARALEIKLTREGFDVVKAHDGKQALFLILNENFDMVLLDLVMPKKNGFTVLEEMREKGINVDVLVLTNLSQEEDREKVLKLGAYDMLVKADVSVSDIVEYIKRILESKEQNYEF